MNTKTKKMIKISKKQLKNSKQYNKYKKFYKTKSFRFPLIKIYAIFANNQKFLDNVIFQEISLIKEVENIQMWQKALENISQYFDQKFKSLNWNDFGQFLFYTYNISEFYNKKSLIKNIYTYENFNELNQAKANHYNRWLKSLYQLEMIDFNQYVIDVLKVVK